MSAPNSSGTTYAIGVRRPLDLLAELDARGVPYVSWKDNHDLARALAPAGEIDLFVPASHHEKFTNLVRNAGWLRVDNPVAQYPDVEHWYASDPGSGFFHLHVYFRVITGESWLKEYLLPLDDFMIEHRVRSEEFGVWILSAEAQRQLFVLRHLLKGGSVTSRLNYRRTIGSFQDEWAQIRPEGVVDALEIPGGQTVSARRAGLTGERIALPKTRYARGVRRLVRPYLRFNAWTLPLRRAASFTRRLWNRLVRKERKLISGGGLIVAVSGVDGSGKTTTMEAAAQHFGRFLTVRCVHLGRPQGPILERLRRILRSRPQVAEAKASRTNVMVGSRPSQSRRSPMRVISAVLLALLRLRASHRARKTADRGILVLADRWPSSTPGKVDGPRLDTIEGGGPVYRLAQRIEHWAYGRMARADACFWFEVKVETAIARNEARIKAEKESADDIRRRYEASQGVRPIAREVVTFENDGAFEDARRRFIDELWARLVARAG